MVVMFGVLVAGRWTCSEDLYYSDVAGPSRIFSHEFYLQHCITYGGANMFCIDMSGIHLCGLCFKEIKIYKHKYHHSTKLSLPENITSLLPSVLL